MFGRFVFESGKYVFLSAVATSLRDASFKGTESVWELQGERDIC